MGQARKPRSFLLHLALMHSLVGGLLGVPLVNSAAAESSVFEGPVPRPSTVWVNHTRLDWPLDPMR